MRWTLPLLVACSSSPAIAPTPDSGTVSEEDAAAPLEDAGTPLECTESKSCIAYGTACDGGYRYGCYAGRCPVGAVGACAVVSADTIDNYAEACCGALACVRQARPGDTQCAEAYDGGTLQAWTCPAGAKPPGKCRLRAGTSEHCCDD